MLHIALIGCEESQLVRNLPRGYRNPAFRGLNLPGHRFGYMARKAPPKVATASLGPELLGGGFKGAFRVDVAWPRARVPGGFCCLSDPCFWVPPKRKDGHERHRRLPPSLAQDSYAEKKHEMVNTHCQCQPNPPIGSSIAHGSRSSAKNQQGQAHARNPRVAFLRCSTVKSPTSLGNNLATTSLPRSLLSRSFATALAFFFSFSFTNSDNRR